jgi:rubrerythrin
MAQDPGTSVQFNAFEAFEIAEQIERNGAKFYRRAAQVFGDSGLGNLFLELADWEKSHEKIFARMRKQLSEQGRELRTFRPEDRLLPDVQAMAGLAVFGIRPNPADELNGTESRRDVLEMAMEKEKDSIVYYTGLKDFVADIAGRDKIDEIIGEEMRHIRILRQSLASAGT